MNRQTEFARAIDMAETALSNARGYFDDESTEASESRSIARQLAAENDSLRKLIDELNDEINKLSEETR